MSPAKRNDNRYFPPTPPPPGEHTDRFGLPTAWTLLDFDTAEREAAVIDLVREVFETAVRHLGEDRVRSLFAQTSMGQRGRRPNDGLTDTDRDLLAIHDARAPELSGQQLRQLPRRIANEIPKTQMQTPEAVERRLRRALTKRAAAFAKAERERIEREIFARWHRGRFGKALLEFETADKK